MCVTRSRESSKVFELNIRSDFFNLTNAINITSGRRIICLRHRNRTSCGDTPMNPDQPCVRALRVSPCVVVTDGENCPVHIFATVSVCVCVCAFVRYLCGARANSAKVFFVCLILSNARHLLLRETNERTFAAHTNPQKKTRLCHCVAMMP